MSKVNNGADLKLPIILTTYSQLFLAWELKRSVERKDGNMICPRFIGFSVFVLFVSLISVAEANPCDANFSEIKEQIHMLNSAVVYLPQSAQEYDRKGEKEVAHNLRVRARQADAASKILSGAIALLETDRMLCSNLDSGIFEAKIESLGVPRIVEIIKHWTGQMGGYGLLGGSEEPPLPDLSQSLVGE